MWDPPSGYDGVLADIKIKGDCNFDYTGSPLATCQDDGTWSVSGECYKNCPATMYQILNTEIVSLASGVKTLIDPGSSACSQWVGICFFSRNYVNKYIHFPIATHNTAKTSGLAGFIPQTCWFTATRVGYFYIQAKCNDGKWEASKAQCMIRTQ